MGEFRAFHPKIQPQIPSGFGLCPKCQGAEGAQPGLEESKVDTFIYKPLSFGMGGRWSRIPAAAGMELFHSSLNSIIPTILNSGLTKLQQKCEETGKIRELWNSRMVWVPFTPCSFPYPRFFLWTLPRVKQPQLPWEFHPKIPPNPAHSHFSCPSLFFLGTREVLGSFIHYGISFLNSNLLFPRKKNI